MADLIDRAKAIKAIEDMQDCYNGFSGTYDKAQIIGVLEEVPTAERKGHWMLQEDRTKKLYGWHICSECGAWIGEPTVSTEPQWVPCTAKFFLPINGTVIVSDGDKYVTVGYLNIIGEWYDMHGNRLKDVRAWMPLPQPYKGETDG